MVFVLKKQLPHYVIRSATAHDPDHSMNEHRWITFGLSSKGRLIVVSHTERDEAIRIISARLATKQEKKIYEEK